MRVVERRRGISVVWGAVKREMLISGNSTGIEEISSPCIATCWCVSREARKASITSSGGIMRNGGGGLSGCAAGEVSGR